MTSQREMPGRVRTAFIGGEGTIELVVSVSDNNGIVQYGFAFGGVPVIMHQNSGVFHTTPGAQTMLEWIMRGEPGSFMKVTVTRDGQVISERAKSTIPPPHREGFDAFIIEVA